MKSIYWNKQNFFQLVALRLAMTAAARRQAVIQCCFHYFVVSDIMY